MWVSIEGFPPYLVSSEGLVKGFHGLLTPSVDKDGYYIVTLYTKGLPVKRKLHRVVATAFVSNIEEKPQVNHKDGNKGNNRKENLEWVTAQENVQHAYDHLGKTPWNKGRRDLPKGLGKPLGVKSHKHVGSWVTPLGVFTNLRDAGKEHKICHKTVRRRCLNPLNTEWRLE